MVKAAANVPLKWRVTDVNGVGISDPTIFRSLSLHSVNCPTMADTNDVATGDISVGSGLSYEGDGVWKSNWKTPKTARGCRDVHLWLAGSADPHVVQIQLR